MAYLLTNISAKNYQNQLMYVEAIASDMSVVSWDPLYFHYVCVCLYLSK